MADEKIIYLDNSATTKMSEAALKRYIEVSNECFGNPSSLHALGFSAEKVIDAARRTVLESLGVKDGTVIFTSSGSEANNLAIIGHATSKDRYRGRAKIITTEGEHASVDMPTDHLRSLGYKVAKIPTVGGKLDMGALKEELTPDVVLVSMMMVNNETGALYDLKAVKELMKTRVPEAYLHADATQSYMKLPFTMASVGCDMITVSSHKIHGPKGVGALAVVPRVIKERGLVPIVLGGGQESGFRSGTQNVPGIAAFAEAIKECRPKIGENYEAMNALREAIKEGIKGDIALSGVSITDPENHAPHILNITLPGIKSETMLHYLSREGIFVSSGSACSSNGAHASSALVAYGRTPAEADCSIRISLSHLNQKEDVEAFVHHLAAGVSRLARMR